ncbi:MAG: CpXC domain-containing protein [Chloroflexota bacterium]|nr:CpXC domain-containing protein [Chloroflexota bacterium]
MPYPAMPTQVTCPQCNRRFVVSIHTIIDVGEEPELKEKLLRGELNYAECPDCGAGGVISTPLLYHDPEKELLISFVPPELDISGDEREKLVGSLINSVMNNVPQEERKGYFFQPQTALTMESFYDMILEADGISREALRAHRKRVQLIERLMAVADDEQELDRLVEENREQLDYEFFLTLSNLADVQEGEEAQRVRELREALLERVNVTIPSAAPAGASYDDLVQMLQETEEDDAFRQTVALNRSRLDYGFFQNLTAKIDAARNADDEERAKNLKALRERILEEIEDQDRMVQQAQDKAALLLMRLSEADDLEAAVREHRNELDTVFFVLLNRYRQTAENEGDTERVEKLDAILNAAQEALEEQLSPEARLINRLLRAEHPEETDQILEEHRDLLTDQFLDIYDTYIARFEQEEDQEAVDHLQEVREQVLAKKTVLRS